MFMFRWPAQAVIMQERLPPDRLDRYFRMLSISSRLGVFTSMLASGALLSRLSWQTVTWIISAFGGVVLLCTSPLITRRPVHPAPGLPCKATHHAQDWHDETCTSPTTAKEHPGVRSGVPRSGVVELLAGKLRAKP